MIESIALLIEEGGLHHHYIDSNFGTFSQNRYTVVLVKFFLCYARKVLMFFIESISKLFSSLLCLFISFSSEKTLSTIFFIRILEKVNQ